MRERLLLAGGHDWGVVEQQPSRSAIRRVLATPALVDPGTAAGLQRRSSGLKCHSFPQAQPRPAAWEPRRYFAATGAFTQRNPTASSFSSRAKRCREALVSFEYSSFQDPLRITTDPSLAGWVSGA